MSTPPSDGFKRELLGWLPDLRAFARALSGNADLADDLVQETVLRAWAKADSYQPGTNMRAWLCTILRNEFYGRRRKKTESEDPDGALVAAMAVPASQESRVSLAELQSALDRLPDDQREALILVGASGFSYEDAAGIAGCAVGTMKSRASRGRAELMRLLDTAAARPPAPKGEEPDAAAVRAAG